MSRAGLAELGDASHFDDRGLLLPLCKAGGLLMVLGIVGAKARD